MAAIQPVAAGLPAPFSAPLSLAAGVELLGDRTGSRGSIYLIRRGDGRMLEVSALLYAVAEALGGRRGLVEVAEAVSARCGRLVTPENVRYLVEHKLHPLGVTGLGSAARTRSHSPLALTVRAGVIPDGVVGALASGLRWLFAAPVIVVLVSALALFDVWLLHHGVGALEDVVTRPSSTLIVVLLTLFGAAFHELGHAAAGRYSGVRPGVIGIGIYLVWPVFFNDLNDSYRLGRSGRLRCDLGGVYFNGVFALVLGAAYAMTGMDMLLLAAAVQHVAILQQFLPFVRLDGYYIVADLADVPDLFRYTVPVLRSLLPGNRLPSVPGLSPGARAAVVAWVFTTVPALVLCSIVLVVNLPELVATAWQTAGAQWASAASAFRARDVSEAVLSGFHLALLAVPPVGLVAAGVGVVGGRMRSRTSPAHDPGLGADEDGSFSRWTDAVAASDETGLATEDRWDAPDATASLLWLDPADRWLPLPDPEA